MTAYDYSQFRVLVIDDNKHARKLAGTVLKSLGCEAVGEAASAEEAFAQFDDFKPNLLLVDYKMKPTDGLAMTASIRADQKSPYRSIPIILITAEPSMATMEAASEAGVNEFLPKPFSPQALKDRLNDILSSPAAA